MTYSINVHDELPLVHTHVVTDRPIHEPLATGQLFTKPSLVCEGISGYTQFESDYTRRLTEEAELWMAYIARRGTHDPVTATRSALRGLAATLQLRAHTFLLVSELEGSDECQATLWKVGRRLEFGSVLDIHEEGMRLAVSVGDERLGWIRSRDRWARSLVPFGLEVRYAGLNGGEQSDYRLALEVLLTRVGSAVAALNHALGQDLGVDGYGGDGAAQRPTKAAPTQAQRLPDHGGDGATNGLRLVSSGLPVAKPQADTNPGDVVLYREIDGTAKATVGARPLDHVVRHSPTGIEWGYHGSGPADLARSILLAFTDEATTERLSARFVDEVVAAVPRAGGVIPAAEVRVFISANEQ